MAQNDSDPTSNETAPHNVEDDDAEVQSCAESPKDCTKTHEETEQCVSVKPESKVDSKDESCDSQVSAEHKVSNPVEEKDNGEMHELSQTITEKLRFLSEGRDSVSAVQTMQIQLQVCIFPSVIFYNYIIITNTHNYIN